jgi:hypothetical protein
LDSIARRDTSDQATQDNRAYAGADATRTTPLSPRQLSRLKVIPSQLEPGMQNVYLADLYYSASLLTTTAPGDCNAARRVCQTKLAHLIRTGN